MFYRTKRKIEDFVDDHPVAFTIMWVSSIAFVYVGSHGLAAYVQAKGENNKTDKNIETSLDNMENSYGSTTEIVNNNYESAVKIDDLDNTENSHASNSEKVDDKSRIPVIEYKVFNEGEHTKTVVTTKDLIKDVDGYNMVDISLIEGDKVVVTYINAVPVSCMGIDGEDNTFGTIEENEKTKTR